MESTMIQTEMTNTTDPKMSIEIKKSWDDPTGRGAVIAEAKAFLKAHGVADEDLTKADALFEGPHAPCVLHTKWLHVCSVNEILRDMEIEQPRLTGHITLNLGNQETNIALRENCPQNLFLVAYQRLQNPRMGQGKPEKFWGFSLICLETKGNLPLSLTLDANLGSDGQTIVMRFSSQVYRTTQRIGDQFVTTDRLRTLGGRNNIQEMIAAVAAGAGFPLENLRPFPTRDQTSNNVRAGSFNRPTPPAPTTVPATEGDASFSDPFVNGK